MSAPNVGPTREEFKQKEKENIDTIQMEFDEKEEKLKNDLTAN